MTNITMQSGTVVPLSLNFGKLYRLRRDNPEPYKNYQYAINHAGNPEEDQIFLIIDIIYAAYLCAGGDETYEDFLDDLPEDMGYISQIGAELIRPKKKKASVAHSDAQ